MNLIIGGTKFLGRALVDSFLAAGEDVVLFNRGKLPADNMPDVEIVYGDRNTDLGKLGDRRWKTVIDTCGYLPQTVKTSAEFFADKAKNYIFISSISAYAGFETPDFDETAPEAVLTEEQQEKADKIDPLKDITAPVLEDMYGGLKAQCEHAAEDAMPGRVLVIRPGLIVGPYDWTDRFTYWVKRVTEGGEVLAPGDPERFVQFIDVRDLANWTVKMAVDGATGIYNASGKSLVLRMGQMLEQIREAVGSDAEFMWAPEEFIVDEGVQPWNELPLYLPESDTDSKGFLSANVDKAISAGLTFRPFAETVKDTLAWRQATTAEIPFKAGITRERESELLSKFKQR